MPPQNVNLPYWFEVMFNYEHPTRFVEMFSNFPLDQQSQWRQARDGQNNSLLDQSIRLGRKEWAKWFLQNGWFDAEACSSLLHNLSSPISLNQTTPLRLFDVMEMMDDTQWDMLCKTLAQHPSRLLDAVNDQPLSHVFPNTRMKISCTDFFTSLNQHRTKKDIFQEVCGSTLIKLLSYCKDYEVWDTLVENGWDLEMIQSHFVALQVAVADHNDYGCNTYIKMAPMLYGLITFLTTKSEGREKEHEKKIFLETSGVWKQLVTSPFGHQLLNTFVVPGDLFPSSRYSPTVWEMILSPNCSGASDETRHALIENLLPHLDSTQLSDLVLFRKTLESRVSATPAWDLFCSHVDKLIISESLGHSVNPDLLERKKQFKKM